MAIGLSLMPEAAAFENKLSRLNIPTLILFGAHDKVVPPANADLLSKKIAGSMVVIFSDAGHFFPIEIAEAASRTILDFAA
jgi:pimeloyl-ACP methyl ester carboxylesterase